MSGWILALAGALVLLAACSGPPLPWTKPGGTAQDAARDRYECEKENARPTFRFGALGGYRTEVDKDLYRSCMRARGWQGGD